MERALKEHLILSVELLKSAERSPGFRLEIVPFLIQCDPLQAILSGSHSNYLHSTYFHDSP